MNAKCNDRVARPAARRRAFTLVELLVAIAIIGILASLALGVMFSAQQAAREHHTRSLVTKLHTQMMIRWESYRTRRLSLALPANPLDELIDPDENRPSGPLTGPIERFAFRQLMARRELMRMELPDRYKDLLFEPQLLRHYNTGVAITPSTGEPIRPALWQAYRQRIESVLGFALDPDPETAFDQIKRIAADRTNQDDPDPNQSAECLYMIMTTAMESDNTGRALFGENDVADTDDDGMPEFVDGWGNPINWLRWAPDFGITPDSFSDFQKPPRPPDPVKASDRDPFDPRGVDTRRFATTEEDGDYEPRMDPRGYALYPLILSRGPDAEHGLFFGHVTFNTPVPRLWIKDSDPYAAYKNTAADYFRRGRPLTRDFGGNLDNIDNHTLETR